MDTGLSPLLRVGPKGGESERLETEGTRVGRVCEENDGDGGTDGGDGVPWSAIFVTFDLTLMGPPPPPLKTDEEPERFSSFEDVGTSLGGEYMLRVAFDADETCDDMLPRRLLLDGTSVNARWRRSVTDGTDCAAVTFGLAVVETFAFA